MNVYVGCPQRGLIEGALRHIGEHGTRLVVPRKPVRLYEQATDWLSYLRELLGWELTREPSPAQVALIAQVCERVLAPNSYFGKVRALPRFHQQLAHQLVRLGLDGLNPDLLEQGALGVLSDPDLLKGAGLELPELAEEWKRKTDELCLLWREWLSALYQRGWHDPAHRWWEAVERVQQEALPTTPPLLLAGFTELTAVEVALLKALDAKLSLSLALLAWDAEEEWASLFAPSHPLLQRLRTHLPVQIIPVGCSTPSLELTLLDAPNPLSEVEAIARTLLRLHLQEGVPYPEMLLLARQPAKVADTLSVLFERYGIPLSVEVPVPLTRSPHVRFLLEGLTLLVGAGTGAECLAWLENPLLGLNAQSLLALRRVKRLSERSDLWFRYAQVRAQEQEPLTTMLAHLNSLVSRLQSQEGVFHRGALALLEWYRALAEARVDLTDAPDLSAFQEILTAYAESLNALPLQQAVLLLERLCAGTDYLMRFGRAGVHLLSPEQADLVGGRVVCVMEVLEGVLPRRHPDDPFLRESERRALQKALQPVQPLLHLPLRSDYQVGEPLLFYRALTSATEHVVLSYPRTQNDTEALPSFYLEWLRPEAEPTPALAQGLPLTLTAYHHQFFRLEELVPCEPLHPYDLALQTGIRYEEPAFDLRNRQHRERVTQVERPFAVTELEALARCPFQHLAQYILKVRRPQRGLRLTQIGTLVHRTLHRAFRTPSLPTDPEGWARALREHLDQIVQEEELDLSHWQLQVLNAYAVRLLDLFAQREVRYRQQFGLQTKQLEWAFGGIPEVVDEEMERFEGRPPQKPFVYRLPRGRSIQLQGVIDRLDVSDDRSVVMVLDYKLTSAPSKEDLLQACALQGLLYTEVVRQVAPRTQHVVLAYDQLAAGRRVRYVPYDRVLIERFRAGDWEGNHRDCVPLSTNEWRQARQRLQEELLRLLDLLQEARVEPIPGSYCESCAFSDLCRRAHGVHFPSDDTGQASNPQSGLPR